MKNKFLAASMLAGIMISVAGALFITAPNAFAQTGLGLVPQATGDVTPNCPPPPPGSNMSHATYCGDYRVNDMVGLAVNIAQWILGIVGSLTLMMFVYGGIMFMVSAGSSDKVAQAKKIVVASIIGLLIVFSSWMVVRFATSTIGTSDAYIFNGAVSEPVGN